MQELVVVFVACQELQPSSQLQDEWLRYSFCEALLLQGRTGHSSEETGRPGWGWLVRMLTSVEAKKVTQIEAKQE